MNICFGLKVGGGGGGGLKISTKQNENENTPISTATPCRFDSFNCHII